MPHLDDKSHRTLTGSLSKELRRNKMKCKIAIIVLLLTAASANALTQDDFGVGVIIGEPTGLSLKYWLDEDYAIDGAAAWSYSENNSFQLHGDYLVHNYDLLGEDELPVYYGIISFRFDHYLFFDIVNPWQN